MSLEMATEKLLSTEHSMESAVDPYKEFPMMKNKRVKLTSESPFVPTYVQSSLTQSAEPAVIYINRVKSRKILLENPARESRAKKEREERRAKRAAEKARRALGSIGRKEAAHKGIWKLEKGVERFDLFVPLHHLWMGYMSELLGLSSAPSDSLARHSAMPNAAGMQTKLVKADFHGSILTVRQSKSPSLIGLSGIVIHESENTFRVITKRDETQLIPKQNSIFAFAVPLYSTISHASKQSEFPPTEKAWRTVLDGPHIEFELYGNHFRFRAAERAGRKFKHKETIEL